MNLKRVITGLLFAGLGSMAFLAACDPEGTGCFSDAECLNDEICYQNVCRQRCEDTQECFLGEECSPARGEISVCLPAGDPGTTCARDEECAAGLEVCVDFACTPICTDTLDCTGNLECRERPTGGERVCQAPLGDQPECESSDQCPGFADGEICIEGECVFPGVEYYTVMIVDQTTDPVRCADTTFDYDTPGAKLIYIALLDADDNVLHYAEAIEFFDGDPAAFFGDPFDVINGEADNLEGFCPAPETFFRNNSSTEVTSNFHENGVVALGCGGVLFAQFRVNNSPIPFDESHRIEVSAYGELCSEANPGTVRPQSIEDPYDVEICTDRSETNIDPNTCFRLNDDFAQGRSFFDVRFPE